MRFVSLHAKAKMKDPMDLVHAIHDVLHLSDKLIHYTCYRYMHLKANVLQFGTCNFLLLSVCNK